MNEDNKYKLDAFNKVTPERRVTAVNGVIIKKIPQIKVKLEKKL